MENSRYTGKVAEATKLYRHMSEQQNVSCCQARQISGWAHCTLERLNFVKLTSTKLTTPQDHWIQLNYENNFGLKKYGVQGHHDFNLSNFMSTLCPLFKWI